MAVLHRNLGGLSIALQWAKRQEAQAKPRSDGRPIVDLTVQADLEREKHMKTETNITAGGFPHVVLIG